MYNDTLISNPGSATLSLSIYLHILRKDLAYALLWLSSTSKKKAKLHSIKNSKTELVMYVI